ncbi:MAG TPA: LysE family transporter [Anaerolineales bacterium]|jgi:threonine/homoserine/homoserine lactone efflux protein
MGIFLLQGLGLGFAAVVQPGPFMAYLINQTLTRGFRKSWLAAFAPLVSDGPIILLALLVLSQMPAWLQRSLNLASGTFILYLAWRAYRQWRNYISPEQAVIPARQQNILQAVLINIINPMPYIYWSLVTGPILLAGWREGPAQALAFLGGFYGMLTCGLLGILALFGAARNLGSRFSRALLGLSVLALGGFGLLQLWRGFWG